MRERRHPCDTHVTVIDIQALSYFHMTLSTSIVAVL